MKYLKRFQNGILPQAGADLILCKFMLRSFLIALIGLNFSFAKQTALN